MSIPALGLSHLNILAVLPLPLPAPPARGYSMLLAEEKAIFSLLNVPGLQGPWAHASFLRLRRLLFIPKGLLKRITGVWLGCSPGEREKWLWYGWYREGYTESAFFPRRVNELNDVQHKFLCVCTIYYLVELERKQQSSVKRESELWVLFCNSPGKAELHSLFLYCSLTGPVVVVAGLYRSLEMLSTLWVFPMGQNTPVQKWCFLLLCFSVSKLTRIL